VGPANHFSEKYIQYTKEKMTVPTPKRPMTPNLYAVSPREIGMQSKKKRTVSPYHGKSQKININMEIKNLNVYGTSQQQNNLKKKKLHKKTISCLSSIPQKHSLNPTANIPEQKLLPKHYKAKSQENLSIKPKDWGNFLSKYAPPKQD
jgi:hypothetical protein